MKNIFISRLTKTFRDSEEAREMQRLYELYQKAIGLFPNEKDLDYVRLFRQKHSIQISMTHNTKEFEEILRSELGLSVKKAQQFTRCEEEFYNWA